jgi:hypothetical protein
VAPPNQVLRGKAPGWEAMPTPRGTWSLACPRIRRYPRKPLVRPSRPMTLSPTGAAILAAFGASAITGAVTFGITVYSSGKQRDRDDAQRAHERERDRNERENKLEDEQRERLRTGYQAVVFAASTMHAVAKQLGLVWAQEPVEQRDQRLNDALRESEHDLGRAIAGLALEEGTQPVVDGLATIRGDFAGYVWFTGQAERQDAGQTAARNEALALLTQIEAKAKEIEELAREHVTP